MMLVPLILVTYMFPKRTLIVDAGPPPSGHRLRLSRRIRSTLLIIALLSLAMVPVLKSLFEIPPFMVALFGLVILWIYTDLLYRGKHGVIIENLRVNSTFSRIDMSTILFFLGVLMSVAALQTAGQLAEMSEFFNTHINQPVVLVSIFGVISSFLDNVALVAGTMGMYPLAQSGAFMPDGIFWTFLAYCAVTGGNLLIIGSASGVTVMGMEKISFGYYFKRFSLLALLGYAAGAGLFVLLNG
jgi:Na+/H+ antiporter NhaD/arsenite permease-like protein